MNINSLLPSSGQKKNAFAAPAKNKNAICVAIDLQHTQFVFFTMQAWDKSTLNQKTKPYRSRLYSDEFFEEFGEAVHEFSSEIGVWDSTYVTLLLPNNAVSMNVLNIPNMSRHRNVGALDAMIDGLYKNREELNILTYVGNQTKQFSTFSVTAANNTLLKSFANAMQAGGLKADSITFMSNAACNAVSALCPPLRSSSYLLLDIKHHYSVFTFVARGKTTGFYTLPFGYSVLQKNRVASEDMLFDHSVGELAVLNAREKAKAIQLTMMRGENIDADPTNPADLDDIFGEDENATSDPTNVSEKVVSIKSLPKKEPRKLPKFMIRPTPHDDEGFGYENFRLFEKWTLDLLQANDKLVSLGKPEKVYVNMPEDLHYLFDMVNKEIAENGIEFAPLELRGEREDIVGFLELYGGLCAGQTNRVNHFLV